jgi:hypothetical protein
MCIIYEPDDGGYETVAEKWGQGTSPLRGLGWNPRVFAKIAGIELEKIMMKKIMKKITKKIILFLIFSFVFFTVPDAEAHRSKAWEKRLNERTATLWIDAQTLGDDIVLNARGELNVTRVERGLTQYLSTDRDVEEWLVNALNYYSSNRKDTRGKVKGRDVFVLNYRAVKFWNFDPAKLVIGEYSISPQDVLTKKEYWENELSPGQTGTVAVAAPPLKPGQKVELRYEDARATLEVPQK